MCTYPHLHPRWLAWFYKYDYGLDWVDVGQVSRALAPYVAQLVGVDISPRMVEVYNTRANTQGLEPHEMRAVNSLAELHQEQRFDLAVVRNLHFPPFFLLQVTILIVMMHVSYLSCSSVQWRTTISLRSNKSRATSFLI